MLKPIFNVVPPFQGITAVQMNESFAQLLADFLNAYGHSDFEDKHVITAVIEKLSRPGTWTDKVDKFIVSSDCVAGVKSLLINSRTIGALIRFIKSVDDEIDREIWAFVMALKNPDRRRLREDEVEEQPQYTW